jgi:hypothetical protein
MSRLLLLFSLALLGPAAHAQGQIIVVDDTPEVADFPAPQTVAQLPGPDGRVTFREATIAANNTPGPQTIHFNIPRSRWSTLYSDRVLVFSDFNAFVVGGDGGVTVDGRSQTAFTGDTNPGGNEVAFWGEHPNAMGSPMITVTSDNNTFIGLDVMQRRGYGISIGSGAEGNRVIGNTISGLLYAAVRIEGSNNTVGGTAPGEGNRLSSGNDGVRVESAWQSPPPTANRIVGNYLTGSSAGVRVRAGAVGTLVGGPAPEERNVIADAGHYGEEGFPVGEQVAIEDAAGTVVEGNYIGLTADGTASSGQIGPAGILVRESSGTVIRGNVIGGIRVMGVNHYQGQLFGWGIEVEGGSTSDTEIVGNRIGTSADGASPVPNLNGVRVGPWFGFTYPANTTLGGTDPGDGNTVAFNERVGARVEFDATGVAVLGNAFFENGGLGIDLDSDGATANDLHDPDEGANRFQNHPAIASAVLSGGALAVTYVVDTAPANATYPLRVEFFEADPDAEEGLRFLGADTYTEADYGAGMPGSKTAILAVSGLAAGDLVLGTATDAAGNTSEFGAPQAVTGGGAAAVTVDVEPVNGPIVIGAGGGSFDFTVTLTNTTGQAQTVRAWTAVDGPMDRSPVMGPRTVTLPPGGALTRTLTQQVPAAVPAGTYTYSANVQLFAGSLLDSDSFTFTKLAARTAGAAAEWTVSGWDEAVAASALGLPGGFALSEVSPNPFAVSARLTLEVAEAQHVTIAVYDALGRRVAVLHDGEVEAGTHALALDGSSLPAGLYVVRITGEGFAASRRVTRLR